LPGGGAPQALGYDMNGNLTSGNINGDGAWTFGYDAENRLLTADKTAGGTVHATYAYDPLGRRTKKSGAGVTTTYFLSDGADEIAEYDQNKALTVRYVPGPAIDEPVAVVTGSAAPYTHHYFHANRQGSVVAMSDDSGAKAEGVYKYDPYGNCFTGSATPCDASGEPYRFTGRRFDAETGLLYYRARYYWPKGGRFLSTDPVGYDADLNLYAYVGNDPVGRTDPTGLESCPQGQTCPDIPRAPASVESAAVGAAKPMPIAEGNRETGAQVMVDKNNGDKVTEVRTGSQAGQNDPNNPMKFEFKPIDKSDPNKLGADVHPHPRQGDPDTKDLAQKAKQDAVNTRNLYPSKGDYQHMNQTNAPMFNKNTAGAITETFRANGVDHTIVISPGDRPLGPIPGDLHDVVTTP
ncbi:MAG TPA: RHS repeat-associated core domain-containing protein, partial [Hyphomicrobiaceae bacterium]|nr:RHS repeat-associated core domain-containing protein [Hyphomicrobiaceae bacterium]